MNWLSTLNSFKKKKKKGVLPYYVWNKHPHKKRQDPLSITDESRRKHALIRFMGNLEVLLWQLQYPFSPGCLAISKLNCFASWLLLLPSPNWSTINNLMIRRGNLQMGSSAPYIITKVMWARCASAKSQSQEGFHLMNATSITYLPSSDWASGFHKQVHNTEEVRCFSLMVSIYTHSGIARRDLNRGSSMNICIYKQGNFLTTQESLVPTI